LSAAGENPALGDSLANFDPKPRRSASTAAPQRVSVDETSGVSHLLREKTGLVMFL